MEDRQMENLKKTIKSFLGTVIYMTGEEFVKKLFDNDEFKMEYMCEQDGVENLKYFDEEGIPYPADLTPEKYVSIWNRLVDEYELP
jgi:hypothetical protein